MRKSKFTVDEMKATIAKLEKGVPLSEICKKIGVTPATIYNWKKKAETNPSLAEKNRNETSSLKQLQEENLQLKQLVANLSLEKQNLLELLKNK
jgi:putative transposase